MEPTDNEAETAKPDQRGSPSPEHNKQEKVHQ